MPVRANGRGTRDVHAISTAIVSPGATARSSGTSITVRSSALPSSGAMKRACGFRSDGCPLMVSREASIVPGGAARRMLVTSIQPKSESARSTGGTLLVVERCSRIHDEAVFRQAL